MMKSKLCISSNIFLPFFPGAVHLFAPLPVFFSQGVVFQTSDQRPIQEHQRVQADLTLRKGEGHDGTSEVIKMH